MGWDPWDRTGWDPWDGIGWNEIHGMGWDLDGIGIRWDTVGFGRDPWDGMDWDGIHGIGMGLVEAPAKTGTARSPHGGQGRCLSSGCWGGAARAPRAAAFLRPLPPSLN